MNEQLLYLSVYDIINLPDVFQYDEFNELISIEPNEEGEYIGIEPNINLLKLIEIQEIINNFNMKIRMTAQWSRKSIAEMHINIIKSILSE